MDEEQLLDDDIAERLNCVDWHAVTEQEASSFGLDMGLMRRAKEDVDRRSEVLSSTRTVAFATILTVVIGALIKFPPFAVLGAVLAIIATAYIGARIAHRRSMKSSVECEKVTVNCILNLAKKHPSHRRAALESPDGRAGR